MMNYFSLNVHMIFLPLCLSTVCYASKICYVSLIVFYLEISSLMLVVKNLPANAGDIRDGEFDPQCCGARALECMAFSSRGVSAQKLLLSGLGSPWNVGSS